MRPLSPPAAAALAFTLLMGAAGCGAADAPGRLEALLDVVPAEVADRGLFYTRLDAEGPAFGSALPLRRADELLGVDPDDLTDVLETGGVPLTAVAGRIRPGPVAEAVRAQGYTTETVGGWTVFARGDETADAGPLAAAVPAGAASRGLLVLGDAAEVRAAVEGAAPVSGAAGVTALVDSLGEATAAALLSTPEPLVTAALPEGGVAAVLERSGGRGALPAWDAAALAWTGDEAGEGAVLLAYDRPVDGHEAARALVLRAATSPLLGEGRRVTADLFERGAPRWDADGGVVRLPIRWRDPDPARLRRDVEDGALLFLAPTEP